MHPLSVAFTAITVSILMVLRQLGCCGSKHHICTQEHPKKGGSRTFYQLGSTLNVLFKLEEKEKESLELS